ncbi:MAG TPA: undecaprenyl-phosphate glucose phosphotransferase [Beijerinckiaceae bacterium]|nr:undecaprenyl-phosphate glucose phosphotransferase [Beijerinckiaceae bacterium]
MTTRVLDDRRTLPLRRSRFGPWRWFGWVVAACDVLLVAGAAVAAGVAYHLAVHAGTGEIVHHVSVGTVVGLIFVTINALMRRYRLGDFISASDRVRRPFATWNVAFLYTGALHFIARPETSLSRASVVLFYGAGLLVILLWRHWLTGAVAAATRSGRISARRVVLVGDEAAIESFARRYRPWDLGFEIAGRAVVAEANEERDLDRAVRLARALHPDDVFVLTPWAATDRIERIVDRFLALPVSIHLGPERVLDRFDRVQIVKVSTMATLCLARPPISGLEILGKRLSDIVMAAAGLLALMPLFALVALLIRLDGPGPVLFRQQRWGFNQRPFSIVKFRTMRVHDDSEVRQATQNDDRVTRIGRFLRRWNIDELPQLWNVLVGDMSIVGPRPHAVPHNQLYERRIGDYARRHNVKPGITGWAQVNGARGETDTDEKMRRRIEYDLHYIDNWSLLFDLRIIGLTLISPKAYRNAY